MKHFCLTLTINKINLLLQIILYPLIRFFEKSSGRTGEFQIKKSMSAKLYVNIGFFSYLFSLLIYVKNVFSKIEFLNNSNLIPFFSINFYFYDSNHKII